MLNQKISRIGLSDTDIQRCILFQQCPQEVIQYAGNNAHVTHIHLYAHTFPAAAALQETLVCFPDVCVCLCAISGMAVLWNIPIGTQTKRHAFLSSYMEKRNLQTNTF